MDFIASYYPYVYDGGALFAIFLRSKIGSFTADLHRQPLT